MHKKILRILSLALAILLLVSVIPQEISANELEISEIRTQITSTYKLARKSAGRKSFSGYCASLVNWQLYHLGITAEKTSNNGNQEYDYFSKMEHTTGGYRVNAYSVSRYTLEEALNLVSRNGTRDAYNMIVCFQSTGSGAGRRYGHAFLVHAIIDGVVYFNESSEMSINGTYYPEGSAIAVPIKEFCEFYNRYAQYEGLIHFGRKTYADECEYFASNLHASITEDTTLYSAPCTPETDGSSKLRTNLRVGERVHVVGLYRNTEGEYWYELEGGHEGYIKADHTEVITMDYSDVKAVDIVAPNNLRAGTKFGMKGLVRSDFNRIYTLRAEVYSVKDGNTALQYTSTAMVDSLDYALSGSSLSNNMPFRKLSKGTYQYKLSAVVGNYYFENGIVALEWKTITLWNSQFEVVSSRGKTSTITFNAMGGTSSLDQLEISTGAAIGNLPVSQRPGYAFAGWYTHEVGGEKVSDTWIVDSNVTLYARWIATPALNGWVLKNGVWSYLQGGQPYCGLVDDNGLTYYTDHNGIPSTGWTVLNGNICYFSTNGVLQTGLTIIAGQLHLLDEKGRPVTGWAEVNGNTCYLKYDGSLNTGWITIDGDEHYFDKEDGSLIVTKKAGSGPFEYIIHDNLKAGSLLEPLLGFAGLKPLPLN